MAVYVDDERCSGCGICLDACPAGALRLVDGVATIDQVLCRNCKACVAVCPVGAILDKPEVERLPSAANLGSAVPLAAPAARVMPAKRARKVWPWLAPALAFVGREVVPRVASALLDAWDQRSGKESLSYDQSQPVPSQPVSTTNKLANEGRRQFRHRHGGR